jgi:hypothetical protein
MRDFPDEMMPDADADLSFADYRAMAEWHWAHNTQSDAREDLRDRADRRRQELLEMQVDLSDPAQIDSLWAGWQLTWHESLNYGVACFGEELVTPLVHIMQFTSIILLLATEPETPDPFFAPEDDMYDD